MSTNETPKTTVAIYCFMRLHDTKNNKDYRILNITADEIVIIGLGSFSLLDIQITSGKVLMKQINSGEVTIVDEPEDNLIADVNSLSGTQRIKYETDKLIIDAINAEYAPSYLGLLGKQSKPVIKNIIRSSKLTRAGVWRVIIRYLQSGCKYSSLLKKKPDCDWKDKTTAYKRGRVSNNPERNGKILTDADREIMKEYVHKYISNPLITKKKCYDDMIIEHYTETSFDGKGYVYAELPPDKRPTLDQFIYFMKRHTTKEQRMESRLGRREFRNQKRLLVGTSLNGVTGPASIVEMDACELDVSVISAMKYKKDTEDTKDKKAVGSPVVYFMIDLYSKLILAASISFDNNSILAMTNCLASLVEDKEALLNSLGITLTPTKSGITLSDAMPQNILPKVIRMDHGADFISKQAQRIGQQLNVEVQYAPPGTGSMKGSVENSFHKFQGYFMDLMYKKGAKLNDGVTQPNKEAVLTIEDIKFLMYSFILEHNTVQHDVNYHLTPDMVKCGVGHVPAEVWRYGIQHAENPTYITDRNQFLFSLLTPVSAKLRRDGIKDRKSTRIPDLNSDTSIRNAMLRTNSGSVPFQIYIDLRSVAQIYYLDDNRKLWTAKLVQDINHKDFLKMTWPDFDRFLKDEKELLAQKDVETGKTRRAHRRINKAIVAEAKYRKGKTDDKDMKKTRAEERTRVALELAFSNRFGLGESKDVSESTKQIPQAPEPAEKPVDLASMTEAELEEYRKKQIAMLANFDEDNDY